MKSTSHSSDAEPRNLRILHAHSGNLYGGVEALLVTLARYRDLCPQMQSHFALCFEGRLSDELLAAGAPVYRLTNVRIRRPTSVLRARRILRDLLNREHFDLGICHSGWSQALFGPLFRSAGLPVVFWHHDAGGGPKWLDHWGAKTAPDLALCNSQFTARAVGNQFPSTRTEVVYCPVADQPTYSNADRKAIRAALQTPEEAIVIVQVSRMEAWKGHALHLEALSLLKSLPGWICWQVGGAQRRQETRYLKQLKGMTNRLGITDRVRFLGQRADVARLLQAADIYCQPNSGPEPFGIAFIEALYAGLPVITTNIGAATEIVDDSCGLLVGPNDSRAVAEAVKLLIENRQMREKLREAGPARGRQICDVASQMGRLQSCFLRLQNSTANGFAGNVHTAAFV